jgi:hypothetical protein
MKNKLKIVNENGMYVGYALKNDEVVFKTNPCKDTISCSRALSQYAGKQTAKAAPVPTSRGHRITQTSSQSLPTSTRSPAPVRPPAVVPTPTRRCCGRG